MLFHYAALNIRSLLKNRLGIFLLIFISEIAAALCILFSYGLVMKMQDDGREQERTASFYSYELPGTAGLRERFGELKNVMINDISSYDAMIEVKDENGVTHKAWIIPDSPGQMLDQTGIYVLDELGHLIKNGSVKLNGKDCKVIELCDNHHIISDFKIPEILLTDDMQGLRLDIKLKPEIRPTAETVDYINSVAARIFGGTPLYNPKPADLMEKQQNNTFYAYAFVIVMIAVMNLAMYFRYIVGLRKKQIRILTSCGATTDMVKNIFLIENLIELIAGYLTAFLVFRLGLFRLLLNFYPGFEDYYSGKVYLMTFAIFAVGSALILMLLISPDIRRAVSAGKEK